MRPKFEHWMAQLTEWMDARDIATTFDDLSRAYYAGMSPAEASYYVGLPAEAE